MAILTPSRRLDDGRHAGRASPGDVLQRQVEELPLVVREEAVFLRDRRRVASPAKRTAISSRVDLHLGARQRRLEPVGDAVVVGAEHDGVAALHLEAKLVVVLGDLAGSPRDRRLDHAVDARGLRGAELRADARARRRSTSSDSVAPRRAALAPSVTPKRGARPSPMRARCGRPESAACRGPPRAAPAADLRAEPTETGAWCGRRVFIAPVGLPADAPGPGCPAPSAPRAAARTCTPRPRRSCG